MGGRRVGGPALGRAPWPIGPTLLSALVHVGLAVAVVVGAHLWAQRQPRTYVVNLVPAVPAVGRSTGVASLPPRVEEVPQARQAPTELPRREIERAPSLPERVRSREALGLPERTLRPRALPPPMSKPRPGDKEPPTVAGAGSPAGVGTRVPQSAPPAPSLGQPTGSLQGSGPLKLEAGDFPFTWYLMAVQRKITQQWTGRALPGQQPVAVFDIQRDGRITNLAIGKSSGNPYYDMAALRAIREAAPFRELPEEFKESFLRVNLGFVFSPERG
jgi:TonB family protein